MSGMYIWVLFDGLGTCHRWVYFSFVPFILLGYWVCLDTRPGQKGVTFLSLFFWCSRLFLPI
jgi:hypothetical protein